MNYTLRKKGFTLFESLIAMSILGLASGVVINTSLEESKETETKSFVKDLSYILKGVDSRLKVDGYNAAKWNTMHWSDVNSISNNLIDGALNASTNEKCAGGEWTPDFNSQFDVSVIPCGLWGNKKLNYNVTATLTADANNYIQDFEMIVDFEKTSDLEKGIKGFKSGMLEMFGENESGSAGNHYISFVDGRDTNNEWTTGQCLNDMDNCQIKASLHRAGGSEYLRMDGENSMIGEDAHLSFVGSKGQAPLKCVKWSKTGVSWRMDGSVDCGIGLYEGTPAVVELATHLGGFEEVYLNLDHLCDLYQWNGNNVTVVPEKTPCGFLKEDVVNPVNPSDPAQESMIQVVESTYANIGVFENVYLNEAVIKEVKSNYAEFEVATLGEVEAKTLASEKILINDELVVEGESDLDFIVADSATVKIAEKSTVDNLLVGGIEINESVKVSEVNARNDLNLSNVGKVGKVQAQNFYADKIITDSASVNNINMLPGSVLNAGTVYADEAVVDTLNVDDVKPKSGYYCAVGERLEGTKCIETKTTPLIMGCEHGGNLTSNLAGDFCLKSSFECEYDTVSRYIKYDGARMFKDMDTETVPPRRVKLWSLSERRLGAIFAVTKYDRKRVFTAGSFVNRVRSPISGQYEYHYSACSAFGYRASKSVCPSDYVKNGSVCEKEVVKSALNGTQPYFKMNARTYVASEEGNFDNIEEDIDKLESGLNVLETIADDYAGNAKKRNKIEHIIRESHTVWKTGDACWQDCGSYEDGYDLHLCVMNCIKNTPSTGGSGNSNGSGGSGGNSCSAKCSSAPSRDAYQRCMNSCNQNGSGGSPACGANGCGNNGNGGR